MKAEITGGEVSDYRGFDTLLDADLPQAKVMIADKGYDSNGIRDSLEARGATPVILGRANRKQPIPIDTFIYALRNRIERCFNKLKCSRQTRHPLRQNRDKLSRLHSHRRRKTLVQKFVNMT